jgi:ferredoxin
MTAPLPTSTAARSGRKAAALTLHIDWVACDGRGLCAELLPELLTEDPWGYPMPVDPSSAPNAITVPDALRRDAEEAVSACPLLALRLERR